MTLHTRRPHGPARAPCDDVAMSFYLDTTHRQELSSGPHQYGLIQNPGSR